MKMRNIAAALLLTMLFTGPVQAENTDKKAAEAAPKQKAVQGKVLERLSGAGYTYLLIENGENKTWAAVLQGKDKVDIGQQVALQPGMVMQSFESKALGKTFDQIVFSPGLADAAAAAVVDPHKLAQPLDDKALAILSGGSARAVVPAKDDLKVDKAEGENSRTVAQCFAEAGQLDGKKVRVQGKVVKFSPEIMGRNWIHLQDGSGNPMKNTHDLVVTTSDTVAKDAVIVIEGVLCKDKDFGAGYHYAAIIESAKVIK
jgi:hypothetical protein